MNLRHEVQEIATELMFWATDNNIKLEARDALLTAVEIQKNKLYKDAHVLWTGVSAPSALEAISMSINEIGMSISSIASDYGTTR